MNGNLYRVQTILFFNNFEYCTKTLSSIAIEHVYKSPLCLYSATN